MLWGLPFCFNFFFVGYCYSIVELETSWEKETFRELGNFIFIPIWFGIVLYINRLFVINEIFFFFLQLVMITWYKSLSV